MLFEMGTYVINIICEWYYVSEGEHTRTKTVVHSKVGGLSAFTTKKETCIGCKTPLDSSGKDTVLSIHHLCGPAIELVVKLNTINSIEKVNYYVTLTKGNYGLVFIKPLHLHPSLHTFNN